MEANEVFLREVNLRREAVFGMMSRVPIAVLIWGPSINSLSPLAYTRVQLRDHLRTRGHLANFSEDFYDPSAGFSLLAQQVADVEAHDLVISLPDSEGSIAEIHDFFKLPRFAGKIVTYLDRQWNAGYANKSLLEIRSIATGDIVLYDQQELPGCILESASDVIRRLQELYYMLGRRV